jgi:hypothetical protein
MSFHFSTAAVKVSLDILSATPETILVLIFPLLMNGIQSPS